MVRQGKWAWRRSLAGNCPHARREGVSVYAFYHPLDLVLQLLSRAHLANLAEHFLALLDLAFRNVTRCLFVHVRNAEENSNQVEIFEIVRVSGVVTGSGREVHCCSGDVFKLLILSRLYLNSFNPPAGHAMDDLVALRVAMFGVFLARRKHCLEDADLLRSICLARDQFPAFKRRHTALYAYEFVLDYAFS